MDWFQTKENHRPLVNLHPQYRIIQKGYQTFTNNSETELRGQKVSKTVKPFNDASSIIFNGLSFYHLSNSHHNLNLFDR